MEGIEKSKEKSIPKKATGSYAVLIGFEVEDGTRYEQGETASNLTAKQVESLIKMNAIAKEK